MCNDNKVIKRFAELHGIPFGMASFRRSRYDPVSISGETLEGVACKAIWGEITETLRDHGYQVPAWDAKKRTKGDISAIVIPVLMDYMKNEGHETLLDQCFIEEFLNERRNYIVPTICTKGPIGRDASSTENVVIEADKDPSDDGKVRMRIKIIDAGWEVYISMEPEKFLGILGFEDSEYNLYTVRDLLKEFEEENSGGDIDSQEQKNSFLVMDFYNHFDCAHWEHLGDPDGTIVDFADMFWDSDDGSRDNLYNRLYDQMEQDLSDIDDILNDAVDNLKRSLCKSMI